MFLLKNLGIFLFLFLINFKVNAVIYSGYRVTGSPSTNNSASTLFTIVLGIGASYFYYRSIKNWIYRKKEGEKPERLYGLSDWGVMLFVMALMALFASGLVFEIVGAYGGRELVREIWYWVYLGFFSFLLFLYRT
ncbi:putative four-helix membrane protein [Acinetobacter pittii]|uniref:putative four-helix membrane protein n=1 Tax=Acinetobacter pittii TaxID=48296 RepID=UPI003B9E6F87